MKMTFTEGGFVHEKIFELTYSKECEAGVTVKFKLNNEIVLLRFEPQELMAMLNKATIAGLLRAQYSHTIKKNLEVKR